MIVIAGKVEILKGARTFEKNRNFKFHYIKDQISINWNVN